VHLSWEPPPPGPLTGYTIKVKDKESDEARDPITIDKECTSIHVVRLKPNTEYTFEVSATTVAGSGPSVSIEQRTEGKFVMLYFLSLPL
jgi:hypothetical protein